MPAGRVLFGVSPPNDDQEVVCSNHLLDLHAALHVSLIDGHPGDLYNLSRSSDRAFEQYRSLIRMPAGLT
jgi:hypothetical protein